MKQKLMIKFDFMFFLLNSQSKLWVVLDNIKDFKKSSKK
jgi:hypothetical protein